MADRTQRLTEAFAALDGGDISVFRQLLRADAQWRGVEGMGFNGETPL
jgi:ketosteroid isomerase-like protein